jgi:hypothetical protein
MAKRVRVKNHHQINGNLNRFVTPALRQHIVRLKREWDDCESRLFDHFYVMNEVLEALTIAQERAQSAHERSFRSLGKSNETE